MATTGTTVGTPAPAPAAWPAGDGELARRIREYDWEATPLGPAAAWPDALKAAVESTLAAPGEGPPSTPLTTDAVNAFLVRFSDAVLGMTDPREIARVACRLVTEALGVERAYWADVDWSTREYVIGAGAQQPGAPGIEGRFPMDAWEPFTADHLSGRPVVVDDAQTDERVPPELRAAYAGIGVGADLATPVVVNGQLRSVLAANQRPPRRWTEAEVALVRGIAGRCWAEAERARTEAALRDSEARYRALATAATDVVYRMGPDWTEMRVLEGRGFLPDAAEPTTAWLDAYVHPDDQAAVNAAIAEAVGAGSPFELEHRVRRVDGSLGWTLSRAVPVRDERGGVVEWVGAASDITARKEAEAALKARAAQRDALIAIAEDLDRLSDEEAIVRAAGAGLAAHLGLDGYQYVDVDEDRAEVTVRYAWHALDVPPVLGTYPIAGFVTPDGLARLRTGEPFVVDDVAGLPGDDPASAGLKAGAAAQKIGAYVAVPYSRDGRWRAYFAAAAHAPRRWTESDIELIREVAGRVMPRVERARAEAALRASEERLRRMVNVPGVGVLVFNGAGTLLEANDAFLAMTGHGRDDVRAGRLTWRSLTPPEHVAASEKQMARLGETGRIGPYEKEYLLADGSRSWMMFAGAALGDGTIVEYCLDVSDRKRADDALRQSEARIQQALSIETVGVLFFRLDGGITDANAALQRMSGYSREELRGMGDWAALTPPEFMEETERAAADLAARGETAPYEKQWVRKDGSRFWGLFAPTRLSGTDREAECLEFIIDITARKEAEAALRASEARQAFLLTLGDALRPLADPVEIQSEAARVLGRHLGAGRAAYAEIEADDAHFAVHRDYTDGVPSFAGRYPNDSYAPSYFAELRAGRTVTVTDAERDARLSEADRAAYAAGMVRAAVAVPLVKGGRLAAVFFLHWPAPRESPAAEVALVEEVGERTWAAVERARAEAALRDSEAQLAADLVDAARLQEVSGRLVQAEEVDVLYGQILDAAIALMRSDTGSMQVLDPERNELVLLAERGFDPASAAFWQQVSADSDSSCGAALTACERVVVPDVETAASLAGTEDLDAYRWSGIRATQSTPLVTRDGRTVGMISTHWRSVHQPTDRELRLLDVLARQAADLLERARAEAALREKDADLSLALQAANAGLSTLDLATGRGTTTPEWSAVVGLPAEPAEQTFEAFLAVVHPDDRERVAALHAEAAARGNGLEFECRVLHPATGERWLLSRSRHLAAPGDGPGRLVGIAMDITERRRAESALRESEERFRGFADNSAAALWILDAATGRLEYLSPAFERIWGETREAMMGDLGRWAELVHPDDRDRVSGMLPAALAGQTSVAEYRIVRPADGAVRWVRDTGFPIRDEADVVCRVAGIAQDITDQKQAEAALRAGAERQRELAEDLDFAFAAFGAAEYDADLPSGAIRPSPRLNAMYEFPPDHPLTVAECVARFHPDDRPAMASIITRAEGDGELSFQREFRIALPGGGERWVLSRGRVELSPHGVARHMRGASIDITERKRAEERQAFLLRLADALRPMSDPAAIRATACRLLADALRADRVYFGEIHEDGAYAIPPPEYARHGGPPIAGRYAPSEFAETIGGLADGESFVVPDVANAARLSPRSRAAYAALGIAAFASTPLFKGDRLAWTLTAAAEAPRAWSDRDITLVRDVGERTWEVVERARATAALAASEARYRATVDQAAVGIVQTGTDGTLHMTNPGFRRFLGYEVGELAGLSVADITHPDDLAGDLAQAARVLAGEIDSYSLEKRYTRKDGAVVWGRMTCSLVRTAAGDPDYALAIVEDIDARRRAEEALRASEDRFRLAAEAVRSIIYDWDVAAGTVERTKGLGELLGWSEAEAGTDTFDWFSLVHPDDRDRAVATTDAALAGEGDRYTLEYRVRHRDGGYRAFWDHGRIVRDETGLAQRVVGSSIDLTPLKQAEAALRDSEERYRLIVERATDYAIFTADPEGRIETWPPGAETIFGWSAEEAVGQPVDITFTPEDRAAGAPEQERAAARDDGRAPNVRWHQRKDGRRVFIEGATYARRGPDDAFQGVFKVGRDVTERRRAEEALRESEERFRTVVQNLPDYAIFMTDPDGIVIGWWEGAERVKGYRAEEILGRSLAAFYTPEDVAAGVPARELAAAARTGHFEGEGWRVRKGGERFWGNEIATAVRDEEARLVAFVKISRDLTERMRAEAALRESEERQAFLLELSDALRSCPDEQSIKEQAVTMLAERLRLDRFWISEVFEEEGISLVGPEHVRPGLPPMAGRFRLSEYPETMRQLATQAIQVPHVADDLRFADPEKALLAGLHIGALLVVALRKGARRIVWAFAATMATPRRWTEGERVLLEEVAERTWAAVERARAEAALRENEASLQRRVAEATAELRAVSRRLLQVQEEERRHLARELHDEVGQLLTGLQFQLAVARGRCSGADAVAEAETTVRTLTEQVRQLSMDLRPAVLDRYGLPAALRWHADRFEARTGVRVDVRHDGLDGRLPPAVEIGAFRVVQEALTNVARHAGADSATVRLFADDQMLTVAVRDAGRGFDPAAASAASGLGGMRERVELLGGTLEIDAAPGAGTAVTAEIPLAGRAVPGEDGR